MTTKKVTCTLIAPGVPTASGRIYSQQAVEKLVEMTNQQAEEGHCMVVHEGQQDGRVSLKDVAGLVRKATIEDEKMICTVEMLSTPKGLSIEKLFSEGVSIAPLAYGKVGLDGKVDAESLRINGWSFVLDNKPK